MKKILLIIVGAAILVAAGVYFLFWGAPGYDVPKSGVSKTQTSTTPLQSPLTPSIGAGASLAVEDQQTDANTIIVKEVRLVKAGYVALHALEDGKSGKLLGNSGILPIGVHVNVGVKAELLRGGVVLLIAMVHEDDGDGVFDPEKDSPAKSGNEIVMKSFKVTNAAVPPAKRPASQPTPTPSQTPPQTPPAQQQTPASKEFQVVAKRFSFEPGIITVNKGDTVKLFVKSLDVVHGIAIPDFGVNEVLQVGDTKTIEFVASKAGTYSIFCSIFCGSGHTDMKGVLIVK